MGRGRDVEIGMDVGIEIGIEVEMDVGIPPTSQSCRSSTCTISRSPDLGVAPTLSVVPE